MGRNVNVWRVVRLRVMEHVQDDPLFALPRLLYPSNRGLILIGFGEGAA